jgi:hypothetical protein
MVKFNEAVQTRKSGCSKCFSIIYTLPCLIDKELADFLLNDFGKPKYPLNAVKLLRIDARNGFHIEGRIGTKTIKFVMPKKYEKIDADKIVEKIKFETNLIEWMSQKLNILIEKE